MAVAMVFSFAISVVAAEIAVVEQFVTVNTSASTKYYNPNNTVYVSFELENITLDADGISAFELEIYYDDTMVSPAADPSADGDGDACDFTSLLTQNPGNVWEVFGTIDTELAKISLGFADFTAQSLVHGDGMLAFSMPFEVKPTAKADDIVFCIDSFWAYNGELTKSCNVTVDDIVIKYATQPDSLVTLPAGAVPLDIAGYKHAVNNVIYYAETDTTVDGYVRQYMVPSANQNTMSDFAVIIVDSYGTIIDLDLSDGDKSDIAIPKGCYLIGVHSDKVSALDTYSDILIVGSSIELYNVNVEATGRDGSPVALTSAGFTVSEFALKDDADASIDGDMVIVYEDDLTLEEFEQMFEGGMTVVDADGTPVSDGDIITTGMVIKNEDLTVIILGDCNCDGIVDQFDYLMLKAHVMTGFELSPEGYRAVCITDTYPSAFDYLVVKSYCFGMIDMSQFKPAA